MSEPSDPLEPAYFFPSEAERAARTEAFNAEARVLGLPVSLARMRSSVSWPRPKSVAW